MVGAIGMALMERTVLDPRDGRPVNSHVADHLVPVSLDIPQLKAHLVDEQDAHVNPLGVKRLGEIALIGMAPAIANAVFHAIGKRVRDLPIRIEDVLTRIGHRHLTIHLGTTSEVAMKPPIRCSVVLGVLHSARNPLCLSKAYAAATSAP